MADLKLDLAQAVARVHDAAVKETERVREAYEALRTLPTDLLAALSRAVVMTAQDYVVPSASYVPAAVPHVKGIGVGVDAEWREGAHRVDRVAGFDQGGSYPTERVDTPVSIDLKAGARYRVYVLMLPVEGDEAAK